MKHPGMKQCGFTLIEIMIVIAVFGIVMAGVFSVYQAQLRSHTVQQQIMDMQQNIRAATYLMEREIKTAGLNPTGAENIGFTLADRHAVSFNMDFAGGADNGVDDDEDGLTDEGDNDLDDNENDLTDEADEAEWYDGDTDDPNEQVAYRLSNDADGNGINDGAICNLFRNGETLAVNIDALNFVYLDADGVPLATPVADLSAIRAVQVTVVARSSERPSKYLTGTVDTRAYMNQQGATILPAQNDAFRRLSMTMEVKCRNLGL